jgi:hypothetical protein
LHNQNIILIFVKTKTNTMENSELQQAKQWWETLGDNFLERILLRGEFTTQYYGWMRRPSSLKDNEILTIYLSETFAD